jgi:hypothetical protein
MSKRYTFPDTFLGGDEVSEALADLGDTSERRDIFEGEMEEDFDQELFRDGGDGTWWWGGEFCGRRFALDGEGREGVEEGLQGWREAF